MEGRSSRILPCLLSQWDLDLLLQGHLASECEHEATAEVSMGTAALSVALRHGSAQHRLDTAQLHCLQNGKKS